MYLSVSVPVPVCVSVSVGIYMHQKKLTRNTYLHRNMNLRTYVSVLTV